MTFGTRTFNVGAIFGGMITSAVQIPVQRLCASDRPLAVAVAAMIRAANCSLILPWWGWSTSEAVAIAIQLVLLRDRAAQNVNDDPGEVSLAQRGGVQRHNSERRAGFLPGSTPHSGTK